MPHSKLSVVDSGLTPGIAYDPASLFKIKPIYPISKEDKNSYDLFLLSLEELLKKIIPASYYEEAIKNPNFFSFTHFYQQVTQNLPHIFHSPIEPSPSSFSFTILCSGDYTHGIGRFLPDMLSRWLIPGKQQPIFGSRSLKISFENYPKQTFYLLECLLCIDDEKEYSLIRQNLQNFIKELRLILLAVYHARYIVLTKSLSVEQKKVIIEENIASLLDRSSKECDPTAFDHMQNFLIQISREKKISQIKENIAYLLYKKPNAFDRDIFDEIFHLSLLFNDQFTTSHNPKHVSRIIAFQYLLKKTVSQSISQNPNKRHLSIKLMKTRMNKDSMSLGILMVFNFIHENEKFEKKHMLEAINSSMQDVEYVEGSFIPDRRNTAIFSFYLEIVKKNKSNFSLEELKNLRKKLFTKIPGFIENTDHSIFMPTNEEEIFRNIIILSNQIKYVRDIPQAIISYEKQTGTNLSFTVVLVRLLAPDSAPLKDYFTKADTFLRFSNEDTKIIGYLKKKYPIESNFFKLSLNKTSFLRKDYSLDLQKARHAVAEELATIIGYFRDFNGGMILKQNQALQALKEIVNNADNENEFLLENFFYSISPALMQTVLPPEILKNLFQLFLEALSDDYSKDSYLMKTLSCQGYFVVMIGSVSNEITEKIAQSIKQLKIPSFDLTHLFLEAREIFALGYIYRATETERTLFQDKIQEAAMETTQL